MMDYRVGDCREVLRGMPDGSVQCCVTSPPYYGLRDYGVAGQIGLEPTPDEYVAEMVAVFREVRRVLRDDGTLWLNIGDSYAAPSKGTGGATEKQVTNAGAFFAPRKFNMGDAKQKDLMGIPWLLAFALRANGWYLRSDIIWHKPNPMPESVRDRPTSAHEHVFLLTKAQRYFYDADAIAEDATWPIGEGDRTRGQTAYASAQAGAKGNPQRDSSGGVGGNGVTRNARNVWTIATRPYSGAHFATMPPDLAERCIKAGTSERGACPACGAPWARQATRDLVPTAAVSWGTRPDERDAASDGRDQGSNRTRDGHVPGMAVRTTTTGWAPSCACPPREPVPSPVLDPFGGAGTTALVAERLGRASVLIDLNLEYKALAERRLFDDWLKGQPAPVRKLFG